MSERRFKIELLDMYWIGGDDYDDPFDLCAHGKLKITVDDRVLINQVSKDEDFSLSSSGLLLLRT